MISSRHPMLLTIPMVHQLLLFQLPSFVLFLVLNSIVNLQHVKLSFGFHTYWLRDRFLYLHLFVLPNISKHQTKLDHRQPYILLFSMWLVLCLHQAVLLVVIPHNIVAGIANPSTLDIVFLVDYYITCTLVTSGLIDSFFSFTLIDTQQIRFDNFDMWLKAGYKKKNVTIQL